MNTLILNGLPDPNDHLIVDYLTKCLNGSYKIINFYYPDIFADERDVDEYVILEPVHIKVLQFLWKHIIINAWD